MHETLRIAAVGASGATLLYVLVLLVTNLESRRRPLGQALLEGLGIGALRVITFGQYPRLPLTPTEESIARTAGIASLCTACLLAPVLLRLLTGGG